MNKTNDPRNDSYYVQLHDFKNHLVDTLDEFLKELDNTGTYDNKYNISIELNGKKVNIEFHADAFSRLETLIETELEEFIEIHEAINEEENK